MNKFTSDKQAQAFAERVMDKMLRLRGWPGLGAPLAVLDDVVDTIQRHEDLYLPCFPPEQVAEDIQRREWDMMGVRQ